MKKTLKIFEIVFLFAAAFSGCRNWGVRGNGNPVIIERKVPSFNKVEISGAFYVKIIVGEKAGVKIRAESNLLKYIETEVNNGTLEISSSRYLSPRSKLMIKVTTPELKSVESSGVNKIVVVNVDTPDFRVSCSGASEIKLKGKVKKLTAEVSGASSLIAEKLLAEYVSLDVSGASDAYVFASKILSAEASGASSIRYRGNPEKIETDVSGVSSIAKN